MLLALLLLAQGQFFGQSCKVNQDCTQGNVTSTSTTYVTPNSTNQVCSGPLSGFAYRWFRTNAVYGVYEASTCSSGAVPIWSVDPSAKTINIGSTYALQIGPNASLPTCDATHAGAIVAFKNGGTGGTQLLFCDGIFLFWSEIITKTGVGNAAPIADIQSRTLSSGTITTGNALLGASKIPYAPTTSSASGTMNIADYTLTQCGVSGTGASSMVVSLRRLNNTPATICTVSVPCITGALTANSSSCTGAAVWSASDQYGTTIDVSACTTAPTDCVVTHNIIAN